MYKCINNVLSNVYKNYCNFTIDFSFIVFIYFRKRPLPNRRQKARRQLSETLPNLALL